MLLNCSYSKGASSYHFFNTPGALIIIRENGSFHNFDKSALTVVHDQLDPPRCSPKRLLPLGAHCVSAHKHRPLHTHDEDTQLVKDSREKSTSHKICNCVITYTNVTIHLSLTHTLITGVPPLCPGGSPQFKANYTTWFSCTQDKALVGR